jgi:hypothetical protein
LCGVVKGVVEEEWIERREGEEDAEVMNSGRPECF